jgi:hypothetical protein
MQHFNASAASGATRYAALASSPLALSGAATLTDAV